MKDDAPPPRHPPKKRYQLENQSKMPDLWLAIWANDTKLSDDERERVQEERDRRKALKPDLIIGIIVDQEDVTPPQLKVLKEQLANAGATEIHHVWAPRRVASACRRVGIPVTAHRTMHEVVQQSMRVIAAPRGPADTPAWEAVKYAKHRRLPVTVILPSGALT